jgi:hypothetical protein
VTAQHSEVPWWATPHGIRNVGGYITHTNNVHRYEGQDDRYAREVAEREADKRLIAAAPDLLEALQNLSYSLPDVLPAQAVARFEKTGKWLGPSAWALRGFTNTVMCRADDSAIVFAALDGARAAIAKATGVEA